MRPAPPGWKRPLAALALVAALAGADGPGPQPHTLHFRVAAGKHDRSDSVVRFVVPADRLGPEVAAALADGPVATRVLDPATPATAPATVAELARGEDGSIGLTWLLPRPIPAGGEAAYTLDLDRPARDAARPWTITAPEVRSSLHVKTDFRAVEVHHGGRTVFRYNSSPVEPPPPDMMNRKLVRSGYIHPAFSPGGALVTGDFSPFHPHHRGFFLAYVHTRWGAAAPDFWNIQDESGRIHAVGVDPPRVGPVAVRLVARHLWTAQNLPGVENSMAGRTAVALRERWEVELYDVPGTPYWLFDLTSTQQAETHPLELLPHRYGGMAYRSAEPSVRGPIDVLTAEGRHRLDGDQKPTRWVDLTGPVAEGSPNYAGAMIADHPANSDHPTVARIHPITLPFFSYVPAHDRPLVIATDRSTVFRYRILIHDGRPDPALNDRIAADFAEPVSVRLD